MSETDPAVAKKAIDLRWPEDAGEMCRNSIRDEDFVRVHLWAAGAGVTHDELLVALYEALNEQ